MGGINFEHSFRLALAKNFATSLRLSNSPGKSAILAADDPLLAQSPLIHNDLPAFHFWATPSGIGYLARNVAIISITGIPVARAFQILKGIFVCGCVPTLAVQC